MQNDSLLKVFQELDLRGIRLLDRPALNKGTAFTAGERTFFGLHGLLPPQIETIEEQVTRAYAAFRAYETDLGRHINLRALQDTNEVLFYRLLVEHIEEMMPVIYTPVVGQACRQFSHIYRRPRGLFLSYPMRDQMMDLLRNRPHRDVEVIVVTDGERILGIGDQGVGGLGIPIGKLSLYTLIGGIHPSRTLPIVLDVGTNNAERLQDPEYLGWRHERITGDEYNDFVDQFVHAVKHELPGACLQWEDFATPHALPLLNRYRDQLLTFNDDIQGTAAVTLGALLSAVLVKGSRLRDEQIVFAGAGSASIGVADYLRRAMVREGLSEDEARERIWMVDSRGLQHSGRNGFREEQLPYVKPVEALANWTLTELHSPARIAGEYRLPDVLSNARATILIGLSTVGGAFTREVVNAMTAHESRPIIFPLSNPTDRAEAKPVDLMNWANGRALVATGSPFGSVEYAGKTLKISQCNNVYIFPAVGLGVVAARARRVTDGMMLAAAYALAAHSPAATNPNAPLLPELCDLRSTTAEIALAVALQAQQEGIAPETSPDELRAAIAKHQWYPEYPVMV